MNLLYLTFGNDASVHSQAAFSIYSFLNFPGEINSVNIITDNASVYSHLGTRVNIIPVSDDELSEWKGKYQFFWRVKIKAVEKICLLYPDQPVVYLDTDTFLYTSISGIKQMLAGNMALMHENEGPLSGKKSKTEKRMWQQINNKTFGNLLMQPSDCMWNAGVVATPNTCNGNDCLLALEICDEMCEKGVTRRLIEQYSLSLALQHCYGLAEAKNSIAHYWSVKEIWNRHINNLFLEAYFSGFDKETVIEKINGICKSNIPVSQKTRNTNRRLKTLIDKIFPVTGVQFLHNKH